MIMRFASFSGGVCDSYLSCFVGVRKPDADIYRLALDISRLRPTGNSTSRTPHVRRGREGLGIESFCTRIPVTCAKLASVGIGERRAGSANRSLTVRGSEPLSTATVRGDGTGLVTAPDPCILTIMAGRQHQFALIPGRRPLKRTLMERSIASA